MTIHSAVGLVLLITIGTRIYPTNGDINRRMGCFVVDYDAVPEISSEYYKKADGGGESGFRQGQANRLCREHCGRVAFSEYYGIRRNGVFGALARCVCLNNTRLLTSTDKQCNYRCDDPGSDKHCGGSNTGTAFLSVRKVCGDGYYGHVTNEDYCSVCAEGPYGNVTDDHYCADKNECTQNNGECQQVCINTAGSYHCQCNHGYQLDEDQETCLDIDECTLMDSNGGCDHLCKNTPGGFHCECRVGYELTKDGKTCKDEDECQTDKGGCDQTCQNTIGSFFCNCSEGYSLLADTKSCRDINECTADRPCAEDTCFNLPGHFQCCPEGFEVPSGQSECTDVNECLLGSHDCNMTSQVCYNNQGSHRCCSNEEQYDGESDTCIAPVSVGIIVLSALLVIILVIGISLAILFVRRRLRDEELVKLTTGDHQVVLDDGHQRDTRLPKILDKDKIEKFEKRLSRAFSRQSSHANDDDPSNYTNGSFVFEDLRTKVNTADFLKYVKQKSAEKDAFTEEYQRLPSTQLAPWDYGSKRELKSKNRFKNIIPYDHNRVLLDTRYGDPLSDYINASYISGYSYEDKFIAALGPRPNTLEDFWRMIWEQDVPVIVMVTNLIENGNSKCEQYWPSDGTVTFGAFDVTLSQTEKWTSYVARTLMLQYRGEQRQVVQCHFTVWPDHGVPRDASSLLAFRRTIRRHMVPQCYTVVHCSAGVGRTGTLLALDYLIQQAAAESRVDVFYCVKALRQQRTLMVQTKDQYRFIHEALAEYLMVGDTAISCTKFSTVYGQLVADTSKLQHQLQILEELAPDLTTDDEDYPLNAENASKNRDPQIIPPITSRVYLSSHCRDRNDYINAVVIPGFRKKMAFLATQIPLEDTVVDFWRMVRDYSVKTLVAFPDNSIQDNPRYLPTEDEPLLVGSQEITVTSSLEASGFTEYELEVASTSPLLNTSKSSGKALTDKIRLFMIPVDHRVGTLTTQVVLDVLRSVQKWLQTSGEQPIVVTCLDGVAPCGQFLACCHLVEMMNNQQEVDVFSITKQLKKCRPQFISAMDEYLFLIEFAKLYLSQFDTYANFN